MEKWIKELVNKNCRDLENSERNFAAIYGIMFRLSDNVLAESNDGYRIHRTTYREAQEEIERIASALYERIGATHEYVGLEMENCLEWIIAFWAILRSGNKPYLVNCRHPKSLSAGILSSLKVRYIVSLKAGELPGEYIEYPSLTGKELPPLAMSLFENELALSTSATSLKEVVCFYSGREFTSQLLNTEGILAKNERISRHYHGSLKQLAFLPFYHVFGLVAVYFWFTYFGRTLVFMKDYAPDTILQTVRKHEVTHIFAVPMLWHTIEKQLLKELEKQGPKMQKKFRKGIRICTALQNRFPYAGATWAKHIMRQVTDQVFGPSVQFTISGGSYLKESTLEIMNGIGYALHNGYGMSEIGITSVELRDRPKERNLNSVGLPFDSVEYRIAEDGTLEVRGDSICYAIMVNGERRENKDWFNTGDVMRQDESGNYYILGRQGDAVIGENGENVNPDEIEQKFALKDAESFTVLGLKEPGETHQETLSMIVSVSRFLNPERLRALAEEIYAVNDTLPMASRVRKFYFTYDELAAPTAIKVGRAYVLRGLENGSIKLTPFAEFLKNVTEQAGAGSINPELAALVRSIIAGELGIPENEVTEDAHLVNELGASSLQYYAIVQELAGRFGLTAYADEENYCYTLRTICEYIDKKL